MAFIAAAALAGMVVTSTLATVVLIARATAVRQTARAEAGSERQRDRRLAFSSTCFASPDPSEARGNSITAREMVDKSAQRIGTELAKQPAIQSTLMDTLGTVYMWDSGSTARRGRCSNPPLRHGARSRIRRRWRCPNR